MGPNINLDLGIRFRVFFGQSGFDHKQEKNEHSKRTMCIEKQTNKEKFAT
jgi:hypothetical protein